MKNAVGDGGPERRNKTFNELLITIKVNRAANCSRPC